MSESWCLSGLAGGAGGLGPRQLGGKVVPLIPGLASNSGRTGSSPLEHTARSKSTKELAQASRALGS